MLNIGMIGAGGIARDRHIPGLKELTDVRLAGVANRTRESGERAALEFGFARVYDDWKELADDPAIDAVFVCVQPYMHREMTLYLLERGKHVFCQARMAMDLEDARRMIEADRRTSLTTMLCPAPHYMAVQPYLSEMLEAGRIGAVRHVVLNHPNASVLAADSPLHWRQRADIQGINRLDIGIMAEVMNKLFGEARSLSALERTWVTERPADRDGRTAVELSDSVTVIGELQSGAMLTALYSGAVAGGIQSLTIHGDKATIVCYPYESFFRIRDGQGEAVVEVPPERQGKWRAEAEFVQAIREGRKGHPSFEEGLRYMAFTQAVHDSLKAGGCPIPLAQTT